MSMISLKLQGKKQVSNYTDRSEISLLVCGGLSTLYCFANPKENGKGFKTTYEKDYDESLNTLFIA